MGVVLSSTYKGPEDLYGPSLISIRGEPIVISLSGVVSLTWSLPWSRYRTPVRSSECSALAGITIHPVSALLGPSNSLFAAPSHSFLLVVVLGSCMAITLR